MTRFAIYDENEFKGIYTGSTHKEAVVEYISENYYGGELSVEEASNAVNTIENPRINAIRNRLVAFPIKSAKGFIPERRMSE